MSRNNTLTTPRRTHALLDHCWHCGGDGTLYDMTGPGRFCSHAGNWYPDERAEPCPVCEGTGMTDEPEPQPYPDDSVQLPEYEYTHIDYDAIDEAELPF